MTKKNFDVIESGFFLADTSALVSEPRILNTLDNATLFIPFEVLDELDNLKIRRDEVGKKARKAHRLLDELREKGSLISGVKQENNQTVMVVSVPDALLPSMEETADNKIISIAARIKKKSGHDIICLSDDISFRIKCDSIGLKSYPVKTGIEINDSLYSGVLEIDVSRSCIDDLFIQGELYIPDVHLMPNQGVCLRSESTSALGMAINENTIRKMKYAGSRKFDVEGIFPRSKEQVFALEMLLDPDISLVTLTGFAGCGKTLLSVAAAMQQIQNGVYDKFIMSRPIESTSKDIGFLPGTKEEKMAPWLQPFFDNLEYIYKKKGMSYINQMMNKGVIEIEAISHIRGRSLPNTIFIVDEAQNISRHEAKAVLTRMGENSKIILIGDLEQIDSPKLDTSTSGLQVVINAFKDFEKAGHVTMIRGERSELATHAAKVL